MSDTPPPGEALRDDRSGLPTAEMAGLLRSAPFEVLGRMPWSSNGTFLVEFDTSACDSVEPGSSTAIRGVYKPEAGEQPLWDFPPGLWRREVAAFELCESLGFGVVPVTVRRSDGPFGEGSVQRFVEARFDEHYFTIREMERADLDEQLELLCAFDLVANSADRKGGHCLIDSADRVWAIDNGLTFHPELKLRTVIWDFAGQPLPARARKALEDLCETGPPEALFDLLDRHEVDAATSRAEQLLEIGSFPFDPTGRRYPWPLV